jgi:dihydrofolate reductase
MMMSLDGFTAGPELSEQNPFGIGGIGGGASTVQQYLAAGLVDELLISLVPVSSAPELASSTTSARMHPDRSR